MGNRPRFFLIFVSLIVFLFSLTLNCDAQAKVLKEPKGIADGPGIWVNLWSHPEIDNVGVYCRNLHKHGVRNVFVQTSRSNTEAIRNPQRLAKLIEVCHHYKIRVIAWSFLVLDSPEADANKLLEAARFRTPHGHKFDSVAANIEKDLSAWKVEKLSIKLRSALGPDYPLIAVVFSPLNRAPQVAKTPWKILDKYYDVIAPMAYWNSKYADYKAYDYTRDTVRKVRQLVGRPDVDVHIIGDGMKTRGHEIHQFMKACKDHGVTSASLYPYHNVTAEQYDCLAQYSNYFPVNARFSLAAFSQLRKKGTFNRVSDPAKAISRIEFYRAIAQRLVGKQNLSKQEVSHIVTKFKVARASRVEGGYFYHSMGHKEAYEAIARAVDIKCKVKNKVNLSNLGDLSKADMWFIPPAFANPAVRDKTFQPLNYLEASRLILSLEAV